MATGTAFATVYMAVPMAMPIALITAGHAPSDAGLLAALGALVIILAQPILRVHDDPDRAMITGYLLLAVGLAIAGMAPTCRLRDLVAAGAMLATGMAHRLAAQRIHRA
jgi:hypothetical protein